MRCGRDRPVPKIDEPGRPGATAAAYCQWGGPANPTKSPKPCCSCFWMFSPLSPAPCSTSGRALTSAYSKCWRLQRKLRLVFELLLPMIPAELFLKTQMRTPLEGGENGCGCTPSEKSGGPEAFPNLVKKLKWGVPEWWVRSGSCNTPGCVNFIDTYFRMGLYPAAGGMPFIIGNEAAGEVVAVVFAVVSDLLVVATWRRLCVAAWLLRR